MLVLLWASLPASRLTDGFVDFSTSFSRRKGIQLAHDAHGSAIDKVENS